MVKPVISHCFFAIKTIRLLHMILLPFTRIITKRIMQTGIEEKKTGAASSMCSVRIA